MFLVFNKEKIYAYIVSVVTVCFLFFIAGNSQTKTVETSTLINNVIQNKLNDLTNWLLGNNIS